MLGLSKQVICILFFISLIFLVGTVSAADLTFPFNTKIDIKRPCFNNGTFCSSSASCNITIIYPEEGDLLVDNQPMTYQTSYWNITISKASVDKLGIHNAIMVCRDPGGDIDGNDADTFTIEITGDGKEFHIFPVQLVFFIIGLGMIIIGKTRESFRMIKHLGSIVAMIFGVITLYPGYAFINYTTLLGKTVGFSSIGLGFYFMIEDSFSREKQAPRYEQEEEDDGRFHGND